MKLPIALSIFLHCIIFAMLFYQNNKMSIQMVAVNSRSKFVEFSIDRPNQNRKSINIISNNERIDKSLLKIKSKKNITKKKLKSFSRLVKNKSNPSMEQKSSSRNSSSFNLTQMGSKLSPEMELFFKQLSQKIEEKKVYPRIAKKLRQMGKVIVKFEIDSNGKITSLEITEKSPHAKLDSAALHLIKSIDSDLRIPKSLKEEKLSVILPIEYIL